MADRQAQLCAGCCDTLLLPLVLLLPLLHWCQVVKKNSKVLVICAVGGTLDTNVSYRRDKKLFAGEPKGQHGHLYARMSPTPAQDVCECFI